MGWKFNPFTGALDQTGSGGGGASYLDGEVEFFSDLPLSAATAPLDSAWLVRKPEGAWFLTKKHAGLYIRTATGGTDRNADYTYAGAGWPDVFSDANFTLYDDGDSSRNLKFQLSGISTGTTRTLTVPDGSGTIQLALVRSSSSMSSNVSLSAGRARHITYTLLGGSYQVTLPLTGNQSGDVCRFTNSVSSSSGAILTVARGNGSGGTVAITTLAVGQTATLFNSDGTQTGWTLDGVDTHAHAASEITSGTLDNARVNFAAPSAIGSTTPSTGAFTTLTANNGTLTASAPVLDLAQTWNNAAVTFTGLRFNATDTASAAASNLAEFQLNGTALAAIRKDGSFRVLGTGDRTLLAHPNFALSAVAGGAWFGVNTTISLSSAGNFVTAGGLIRLNDATSANPVELNRDAADTLAQRRTTNPQTFRLYNTTDAGLTNFERGFMRWSSNVLQIGTEKAGTGSARALEFQTDGTTRLALSTGGLVQFAGTTSSFPALKRSSTALQVRLADDSAFAPLECAGLTLNGNLTASTRNIVTDTTTGTRIGTGTTQLLGFWNATPAAQPAAVADATDAATVITQLNALLSRLRTIGIIAT